MRGSRWLSGMSGLGLGGGRMLSSVGGGGRLSGVSRGGWLSGMRRRRLRGMNRSVSRMRRRLRGMGRSIGLGMCGMRRSMRGSTGRVRISLGIR